jgi:hypothetical protein
MERALDGERLIALQAARVGGDFGYVAAVRTSYITGAIKSAFMLAFCRLRHALKSNVSEASDLLDSFFFMLRYAKCTSSVDA